MAGKKSTTRVAKKRLKKHRAKLLGSPSVWEHRLKELTAFKEEHGHCNVPCGYPSNLALALWVRSIRHKKRHGTLAEDRVHMLEALGFCWERQAVRRSVTWEQHVEDLKAFKKEHGHCSVPANYLPNPAFGRWVTSIRKKRGTLTEEKVRLLDALGFCWQGKAWHFHTWEQRLRELKAFKEEHGHCRVPGTYLRNRSLASWVAYFQSMRRRGKLDDETIRLLDEVGFCWESGTESDIAKLRKMIGQQAKLIAHLKKQEGQPQAAEEPTNGVRFSARFAKAQRKRLGLSAEKYAKLVGVSALTIYSWEAGKTKPRKAQLDALVAVRGIGKREAMKKLKEMARGRSDRPTYRTRGEAAMGIRIALLDGTPGVKSAEFRAIPLARKEDFQCSPKRILSFRSAVRIAQELLNGAMDGWIKGYHWYWQGGAIKGFKAATMPHEGQHDEEEDGDEEDDAYPDLEER